MIEVFLLIICVGSRFVFFYLKAHDMPSYYVGYNALIYCIFYAFPKCCMQLYIMC